MHPRRSSMPNRCCSMIADTNSQCSSISSASIDSPKESCFRFNTKKQHIRRSSQLRRHSMHGEIHNNNSRRVLLPKRYQASGGTTTSDKLDSLVDDILHHTSDGTSVPGYTKSTTSSSSNTRNATEDFDTSSSLRKDKSDHIITRTLEDELCKVRAANITFREEIAKKSQNEKFLHQEIASLRVELRRRSMQ